MNKGGASAGGGGPTAAAAAQKQKSLLQRVDADIGNIVDNFSFLVNVARISGSLARKAIRELMARGVIRMVSAHASQQIYTRATNT